MNMKKLSMCRICLVENVRMEVVSNKYLQEIYEKLTDIPLVTDDSRPTLACFLCYSKLKQCCRFQRKCLEAESLIAQMLNEDYEAKPLLDQGQLEYSGYSISPIVNISIPDECPTESGHVINEVPADSEGQTHITEIKDEHQNESKHEFEDIVHLENNPVLEDSRLQLTAENIPPQLSEYGSDDETPLILLNFNIKKEQGVSLETRHAENTRASGAKKPKLNKGRSEPEDAFTSQQKETEQGYQKVLRRGQNRTCKTKHKKSSTKIKPKVTRSTNHKDMGLYRDEIFNNKEKPFQCDECRHRFSTFETFKKHIQVHMGKKRYKCDICERSFLRRHTLKDHTRVHTGEKPYKCDICQNGFSCKSNLKRHYRSHVDLKTYICDYCQHSFKYKHDLVNHIRTHTGERPFKCKVCQKCFNVVGNLRSHMRVHTNEKPYQCEICARSFTEKGHLTRHIRLHTGEKPYKCEICPFCCSDRSNMQKHLQVHMGGKTRKRSIKKNDL